MTEIVSHICTLFFLLDRFVVKLSGIADAMRSGFVPSRREEHKIEGLWWLPWQYSPLFRRWDHRARARTISPSFDRMWTLPDGT